jgi:peptidyl-prolyl cis-trans isomerase C
MDFAHMVAAVSLLARKIVGRLLKDRLVHFAALGGILFTVAPRGEVSTRISLSHDYLGALHAAQAHRLGLRGLGDDGTQEVNRRALEDEVLYREAIRLGLDRDDGLVRQHLIQKTLILAEDLAGASREPRPDELRTYFDANPGRWRREEEVRVFHVFATQRDTLLGIIAEVRASEIQRPDAPPTLGEAFPRSRDVTGGREDIAATYGEAFADAVFAQRPGEWSEPIPSRFGWHLVKVLAHREGRSASFEEVEGRVRLEWAVERRHEAVARFLKRAFERYQLDIDGEPVRRYEPTKRIASRASPSSED